MTRDRFAGFAAVFVFVAGVSADALCRPPQIRPSGEERLVASGEAGRPGGRLVVALRSEPKTLNPVIAVDISSRDVIGRMVADLIHIKRSSQQTEPALAKSWTASRDGRRYTLRLRRGLRFSDGHPLDVEDVLFSFRVYLDEKVHSPQRDLLVVGGKPVTVRKLDAQTVQFELAEPYAAAERLFDGFAVLPRHLLETAYREGKLTQVWGLTAPPGQIAGLGAFRLKEYVPGQRLVLERNPYYWKEDRTGKRLPYLDEIIFLFVGNEDAQAIRFQAGETDVISRLSPANFPILAGEAQARRYRLYDLGPGLEYSFLFFNLNDLPPGRLPQVARKQEWFRKAEFRQAVSAAIDREAIVRLVYQGKAAPLWGPASPGNPRWVNAAIARPPRSLARARELLQSAGFSWKKDGALVDGGGEPVEFTIVSNAGNEQRVKMAAIIQDDLSQLGMRAQLVPLENRALLDRVLQSYDYEACLLALASGDADPNGEMNIWTSQGSTHLWRLSQLRPAPPWEAEVDRLMKEQLSTLEYRRRKRLYDRVQVLLAQNLPVVFLASPHILVGAKEGLGNFHPAVMDPYALWNADELFWRAPRAAAGK